MDNLYDALLEAAVERASGTGIVDLVSVAEAAECGFDAETFAKDVTSRLEAIERGADA